MLANRFRFNRELPGLGRGVVVLARSLVCCAALLGQFTGAVLAQSGQTGASSERTVLDVGGRIIAFDARPVTVMSFTLPFEAGNALLLQDAQQRLRQPDLGPFGSSNGAVLHIVSVSGGDHKLAFERARTIRAALVRFGTAEPRGLAAAATAGDTAAAATDSRVETVTVTVSRLTRASCAACSVTTLGTAAMDSGGVGLVTMETGGPGKLASVVPSTPATSTARTADRREPDANLSFTDRPTLATAPQASGISQADARALGAAAAAAAAAAPVARVMRADEGERRGRSATAPGRAAPAQAAAAPRGRISAEAVKLADLKALGRAPAPGCQVRIIVIDDYLPPQQAWQCGRR